MVLVIGRTGLDVLVKFTFGRSPHHKTYAVRTAMAYALSRLPAVVPGRRSTNSRNAVLLG